MTNNLKLFLLVFIAAILQVSFINNGVLIYYFPNLFLLLVIYFAQKENKIKAYILALLLGFTYDALLSSNFGLRALAFFIVSIAIYEVSLFIFEENILFSFLYVIIGQTIYNIVVYVINFFLGKSVNFLDIIGNIFSVESLILVVLFIIAQRFIFPKYFNNSNKTEKDSLVERFKIKFKQKS